jgi:phospholipid/cholesterol/gamma-HCH transport system permease protein
MPDTENQAAALGIEAGVLHCSGRWSLGDLVPLRQALQQLALPEAESLTADGAAITAMDSAGAWLLLTVIERVEAAGGQLELQGFRPEWRQLLEFVSASTVAPAPPPPPGIPAWLRRVEDMGAEMIGLLAFLGEAVRSLLRAIRHPGRIRWQEILDDMYETGIKALPIVGLLSFLMGVVIAYQGAVQLKLYGANIYIADLVGYSMLRELAPLLTAILICGRTGSAYAAKIGTMKVREEIDALQTIGISPVDLLVQPKVLSLLVVMPLITIYADVLAVFGGMVMSSVSLGVGFNAFLGRLEEAISHSTFMIGVGKAPVFAGIVAVVGCYQGFQVSGSAESVGRHTTISVVQSIFLVIIVDAMFSVLFSVMGV